MNAGVVAAIFLFVVLPLILFGYEFYASLRDQKRYAPPGRLVDVDGRPMHLLALGEGDMTVVLEAGSGGYSLEWDLVQREVATFTRVASYDRAGYGWSGTGAKPRTGGRIAEELHKLLKNAEIPPPYVLVGHSIGGYFIREFTRRYPDEVAGMVLIDSVHPEQWQKRGMTQIDQGRNMRLIAGLARLGVLRFAAWVRLRGLAFSSFARAAYQARIANGIYHAVVSEVESVEQEGKLDRLLGDKPLVVLSRTPQNAPLSRMLQNFQTDLLRISSQSKAMVANKSQHYVHLDEPSSVINAIRYVVDQVRERMRS